MTRGINQEVEIWKKFMETEMWWWTQTPLAKDDKGNFIPDGVDENGAPKFKHMTYPEDQVDLEKGTVLHKKGEDVKMLKRIQGSLRPFQLWEYVIPEECLPECLATLNLHHGAELRSEVKPIAWTIRKAMGAKPVPVFPELKGKKTEDLTTRFISAEGVAVYPIGVKYDPKKDFIFKLPDGTTQGWYQEGL